MMFKKVNENPLLANMDLNNVKTKLQKETEAIVAEQKAKDAAARGEAPPKMVQQTEEEDSEKSDDERPTGIVQPKYKIVHSYPANLGDHWEGHKDSVEGQHLRKSNNLPTEIGVTIYLKHVDSIKEAKLDINESTLVFEYPGLYYLDINLMYKVDSNSGNAKFDKTKKTLTIRVPVVGSTDDS